MKKTSKNRLGWAIYTTINQTVIPTRNVGGIKGKLIEVSCIKQYWRVLKTHNTNKLQQRIIILLNKLLRCSIWFSVLRHQFGSEIFFLYCVMRMTWQVSISQAAAMQQSWGCFIYFPLGIFCWSAYFSTKRYQSFTSSVILEFLIN